jgi:protein ImuB
MGRFVSIWFRYLTTDWFAIRNPELSKVPLVLRSLSHGRMIVTSANVHAIKKGAQIGMALADVRAIIPDLQVLDEKTDLPERLLKKLAEWCIRFTPFVAVDLPDGLFLDATGCTHLWGGDQAYLDDIIRKLAKRGYSVKVAIADTPGAAWAVARYGNEMVIERGKQREALVPLPPESLRIESENAERLHKLGLYQIGQFIDMPRSSLLRRFGAGFLLQLDRALGSEQEVLEPIITPLPYQERLPSLEPIVTAKGIEIALDTLMRALCLRLQREQKGIRHTIFKCYRVDGKIETIEIRTNRPTYHITHLLSLFALSLPNIEPALGIELFVLEAPVVENLVPAQEKMWESTSGLNDSRLAELLDRLGARIGMTSIHRYLPVERYWPEKSFKDAISLSEQPPTEWTPYKLRPLQILQVPERIEVTAPIPDYPPMLFRHRGRLHKIVRADGPERIEREWWIEEGEHRDYYRVEDDEGNRYWLFRSGHFDTGTGQWFLHGYFA